MDSNRRTALKTLSAGPLAAALPVRAQAPSWPSRTVKLIAPGQPGGIFDLSARQIADRLSPLLGQPVVVDNRVGGGGVIAMQHLARSAPDGYTFGLCTFTQLAVNPWMYPRAPYDPVADFAPVTMLFRSPIVLACRPDGPFAGLADVLAQARDRPGRLAYATSGVGQPPHVLFELAEHRARVHLVHIPYRGGPAALAGLLAGDVDLVFEGAAGLVGAIRGGRIRALATTGARRTPALPDTPTFAEAGVPGIDDSWMGIVAPAGTPPAIVEHLQRAIAEVLAQPELRAQYATSGRTPVGDAPDAFAAVVRDAVPVWRDLVRVAGLKPE